MASRHEGDLYVTGSLSAATMLVSAGAVANTQVQAGAAIAADKLQQQHQPVICLFSHADDVAVVRKGIYAVYGTTATILAFRAWVSVAAGATTTVTVDLLKNGTTILSATVDFTNADSAFTIKSAAGFTSTALVDGDVLEVSVGLTGTNEPKGLCCQLVLNEDPA